MAKSQGHAEILVEHAPTITHLQCVLNQDDSFKFQLIDTVVLNGRSYGRFIPHPELFTYVKRFDRKFKATRKRLKEQLRHSGSLSYRRAG